MNLKKSCLFLFGVSFLLLIMWAKPFNLKGKVDVVPVYLGSEWELGIFSASDANRLLPIINYLRAKEFEKFAKIIASREDIKDIFDKLSESQLKVEIRRQYYLYSKGEFLDNFPISFSVLELLKSEFLDRRIEYAKEKGILNLSNLRISSLYGLSDLLDQISPMIKELDLSKNELTVIRNDDFLYYFSRLEKLDLSYNKIRILSDGCFDNISNLRFLDLGHNRIVLIKPFLFSSLKSLWGLDLSDNFIRYLDKNMFFGLDYLKKLNLADNKIEKITAKTLEWLKSLQEISLEGNIVSKF
ncbi:leucine-rich repeat domain-containing protein [Candidatus Babeliales bacterium]|nr:leucine-rich repeat domain-containing protein [Candidatus Babeliales bacterium]